MELSILAVTLIANNTLLLVALINPFGNIPVYVDLTHNLEAPQRRQVIRTAVTTALALVIVFALIGDWSLKHLFDVTLYEFKIAGGILLFIVAVRGVMFGPRAIATEQEDCRMLAVFPLAFPIMTGPGTLTGTIILTQHCGPLRMVVSALGAFAIVYLVAANAHRLMKFLGQYAAMIIPRLLYIFLAAKAVAMVLDGVTTYIHVEHPTL